MNYVVFSLLCLSLSGFARCEDLIWNENHELFGVEGDGRGMKILADLLLTDEFGLKNWEFGTELIRLLVSSFQSCQIGINEAARKMNFILENGEYDNTFDDKNRFDFEDGLDLLSNQDLDDAQEDFSDVFEVREETHLKQPHYVLDLERILRVIEQACTSLHSSLPNIHNKEHRNPQNVARRVVYSLKKWTERWLTSIENKVDVFLTHCLTDLDCKTYLEKVIKTLATVMREDQIFGDISPAVSEILDDLSKNDVSPIESLLDSMDGLRAEEESAFQMASKISYPDNDNSQLTSDEILRKELGVFSKIFKNDMRRFGQKKVDSFPELEIETEEVVRTVPTTFLSVAFGSKLIQEKWRAVKTKLPAFLKIASALSPAILRVGGSAANFLSFDPLTFGDNYEENNDKSQNKKSVLKSHHPKFQNNKMVYDGDDLSIQSLLPVSSHHPKGRRNEYRLSASDSEVLSYHDTDGDRCEPQLENSFVNFTMTENDWKFLVDVTYALNWTLLFDLNQFWRDADGKWDPSNARLLFKDSLSTKIPIVWQLGNEPNAYHHKFGWGISPEQAAEDYKGLRQELERSFPINDGNHKAIVVGPDVTRPRHTTSPEEQLTEDSMEFLERFLVAGNEEIDAVTWHQYYMNGRTATLEEFLSPEMLNVFPKQLLHIASLRDEKAEGKPIWLTETASAWGGGAPGLSNRFAGGFPWLDKLGAAALGGVDLVFRQTLYGGCYSLLDRDLTPYPDFWVTYLHKHLVGGGVLLPRTRLAPQSIRVYAHCLNPGNFMFKKGAIVVFGMNLSEKTKRMNFYGDNMRSTPKFLYKLTSPDGNLKSRNILLNGHILKLEGGGSMPEIKPVQDTNDGLEFSPWSMNFWVFPEAGAAAC